ncbi:MAG: glycosyltransferase [Wenzhouxiangella sp.]
MAGSLFKLLFVLTPAMNRNAGGVQMSTFKLGSHFLAIGHEVAAFSFAAEGHEPDLPFKLFHGEGQGKQSEDNLARLRRILEQFNPDVVINQMPYEHAIGELLKEKKRYLLLGCLRNTLYSVKGDLDGYIGRSVPAGLARAFRNSLGRHLFLARHRRRHRVDLKRILDTYDYFVMFGGPNLEELEYFVPGYDRERIRLVPNSIPAVAAEVPPKGKRLLWLGRVAHAQKRAELILPIWERVSAELTDWDLDVVGDGPELPALMAEAKSRGLQRIHFHGRQVPDDYYQRAPIFFMTSAFEGFPNTLIEAQSFGCIPVVFDTYPVGRWIVDDGNSGFLVPPFQIQALADRIIELARHPARTQLAEQALESARRFHIDRVGQLWQALFETEVPRHTASASRKHIG